MFYYLGSAVGLACSIVDFTFYGGWRQGDPFA
jgi:hypothetical protein